MNSYFRENKIKNFKNEKWIQKTQSQEESWGQLSQNCYYVWQYM
jgi:hypothetical protein